MNNSRKQRMLCVCHWRKESRTANRQKSVVTWRRVNKSRNRTRHRTIQKPQRGIAHVQGWGNQPSTKLGKSSVGNGRVQSLRQEVARALSQWSGLGVEKCGWPCRVLGGNGPDFEGFKSGQGGEGTCSPTSRVLWWELKLGDHYEKWEFVSFSCNNL